MLLQDRNYVADAKVSRAFYFELFIGEKVLFIDVWSCLGR